MSTVNLIIMMMIIQLLAIPGAVIISRLSEKFGNIQTLIGVVLIWVALCAMAYFVTSVMEFYVLGAVVGLIMGGIQSLSRSTYANMMPETKDTASFFSFFDVTEKIALVLGMFSFAYVEELTGSMRNSVLALMTFFIIGTICLLFTLSAKKRNPVPATANS
jgi:UMF1 family MFS transporter